jgi:LytS/YehU family sensor histidine kinase
MDLPILVAVLCAALAVLFAVLWRGAVQRERDALDQLQRGKELGEHHVERMRSLQLENTAHKLNPHLFKNTLNTVQSFAYRTNWALERLGRLFDFMLYDSRGGAVSLEEEMGFLQDLLELNKLRLGPLFDLRQRIDLDSTDPLCRARVVAPLITAPFLENAFKHGDLDSDLGFIHIQAHLIDGIFHYSVQNRVQVGAGEPVQRGGLGKEVLQQRLEAMYPGQYTLHYETDGTGHRATLTLDLNAAHAALRTAG